MFTQVWRGNKIYPGDESYGLNKRRKNENFQRIKYSSSKQYFYEQILQ